jgi:ribosomal protein L7Ae-like RNA K-turn-binding protein
MSDDSGRKIIGYRQAVTYINEMKVKKAYLADDVDVKMKDELLDLLDKKGIDYELVSSKKELGRMHGIKVGASIVCLLFDINSIKEEVK